MLKRDETGHGILRVAGAALAATIAGGQVPLAVPKAAGGQCPSGYASGRTTARPCRERAATRYARWVHVRRTGPRAAGTASPR